MRRARPVDECGYCSGLGQVEMDNNGPIGDCQVCGGAGTVPNDEVPGSE